MLNSKSHTIYNHVLKRREDHDKMLKLPIPIITTPFR